MGPKPPIILDMDGVIYLESRLIPGADTAIARLQKAGYPIYYLTNNATKSRAQIARKLADFGIRARPEHIMSSAYAAARYCASLSPKPKTAYLIGEPGFSRELRAFGIRPSSKTSGKLSDILVSGLDRKATYAKFKRGLDHLVAGRKWVAANPDPTYPVEESVAPGAGLAIGALSYCAGHYRHPEGIIPKKPDFIAGKPSDYMIGILFNGHIPSGALYVGDRLDIDYPVSLGAGIGFALVLSGIAKRSDIELHGAKPDYVLDSLAQLPDALMSRRYDPAEPKD